ncbi:hypothetical protein TPHA_0C04300 [Tetrapisispora phaffii CBS 4417]|uniref:OBG-type G domain-containing protein n=1 Tax=Tetrapisispora phaffii (strain ATCC 24235 / CBS 4417 / NBRC 1672 / NRRL Y-8282 / UCD 70-5) TaxID=1071381 RepID=G8BQR8_TETPH|nr:hypothetical protein TPHA_0C04300 [Tetrapisispora phaffii CBS 4417]CCE62580.1 hypothetical protein TPHA_0C04300 [Tetrapisispora phaffii CBS 4417]
MSLLGRQTSNLRCGIVGLANVGKSTLFQAITNSHLGNPANYPFATINPLDYRIILPNSKLEYLQKKYSSEKIINSTLTLFDIAGLTRGASDGQGLGNKFLNDIRNVDAILHVVRGFEDEEIIHLEESVNSVRDLVLVNDELILKDLEFLENGIERLSKKLKNKSGKHSNSKENWQLIEMEKELLELLQENLYEGKKITQIQKDWTSGENSILNRYNFLTAKPSIILLNVNPHEYILSQLDPTKIKNLQLVQNWLNENSPKDIVLPFSGHFESQYNIFKNNNDSNGFRKYISDLIKEYDLEKVSGTKIEVDKINHAIPTMIKKTKNILRLISYYTCGPKEIREWLIREGTPANEAAGAIHSDLCDTFQNAEIIALRDLEQAPHELINEPYLKTKGLIKRVGKNYIIQNDDIALFRATASKK